MPGGPKEIRKQLDRNKLSLGLFGVNCSGGLAVTTVFLTRYATSMNMKNAIGTFFTGYAISAFIFRVSTRHWSRTYDRQRMILIGLAGHALGHCLLPLV